MTKSLMFAMLLAGCSTTMSAGWPSFHSSQPQTAAAPKIQPASTEPAPAPAPQPRTRATASVVQAPEAAPAEIASTTPEDRARAQARLRVPAMKAEVDAMTKLISDTGILTAGGDDKAQECNELMIAAMVPGEPGEVVITEPPSEAITINQLVRSCENLSAAQGYAEQVKPLRAIGLAGDKLDLVTMNHDNEVFGRGGVVLDAKALYRSNLAFTVHQDSDFQWTLTRYVFKGNKLVSQTDEGFLTHPGPSKFR